MPKTDVFKKIRKIKGEIPANLDKILLETGFESEKIISLIKESDIQSIEDYINENIYILKNTPYEQESNQENYKFKFKPGHKLYILSLANCFGSQKSKKTKSKKITNNILNSDVIDEFESEKFKVALVNKIANFGLKFGYEFTVDSSSISDFHVIDGKIKCKFACTFCSTLHTCEYQNYWIVSNFERHLKVHFANTENLETSIVNTNTDTNANQTLILNYSTQHHDKLDTILTT